MKINLYGYHADQLELMRLAGSYGSTADALRGFIALHGNDFIERFSTSPAPQSPRKQTAAVPHTDVSRPAKAPQSPRKQTAESPRSNQPPDFL